MPKLSFLLVKFDQEWIFAIIFVVVAVGSWIGNILKERKQQQEARERTSGPRDQAPKPSGRTRLDEAIARRRSQLEQVKQQRRSSQPPPPVPGVPHDEPTNLTMAERVQRARAKAQYERRAKELRDKQSAPPKVRAPAETPPRAPRPPKPRRQTVEGRKLETSLSSRRLPAHRPQVGSARVGSAALSTTLAATDAPVPGRQPKGITSQRFSRRLSAKSLRNAIVVKELLDRPLALRDPNGG